MFYHFLRFLRKSRRIPAFSDLGLSQPVCWCGGRNEFVTFLEQCLHSGVPFVAATFGELYVWQLHKVVAGTVVCEVIMALSSLFFCGVHWNPVCWSCLLASVSFCFAFHSLFKFCEFRGRREVS